MQVPLTSAYLQLIQVVHQLESQGPFQKLDTEAIRLLEMITVAHAEERPMTVSAAMQLTSIASPASIHRKLERLRVSGLISHEFGMGNRRTKYLAPTPQAMHHYEALSTAMQKIQRHPAN